MGGVEAGWRARVTPFEMPPSHGPGTPILERIELEVWWMAGEKRRTFTWTPSGENSCARAISLPWEAAAMTIGNQLQ